MKNWKDDFLKEIREISNKKRLKDYDAFVFWYLKLTEDLSDEIIIDAITNKSKDFGIDAIIIDKTFKIIKVFQSKFSDKIGESSFDKDELNKLYRAYNFLSGQEEYSKIESYLNKFLKNKLDEAINLIKTEGYGIKLIFITTNKENLNSSVYFKEEIIPQIVSARDIERKYEEWIRGHTPELGEISLKYSTFINSPLSDPKAYIVNFDVKELSELYKKHKEKLFSRNVRVFYGSEVKPNKAMRDTLNGKQQQNFWYFNNGITLLSDKVIFDETKKEIHLMNPQIINGCQTVTTLGLSLDKISSNSAYLFAKIIEIGDNVINQSLIDGIVEANNRQNPVDERILKSNHPLQVRLQRELMELDFYYERKEGQYAVEKTKSNKVVRLEKIDNKNLLTSNLVIIKQPHLIHESEDELFSTYFSEVFKEDKSYLDYLLPYVIWREITHIGKNYGRENRKDIHKYGSWLILRIFYEYCSDLKNNTKLKPIFMKLEKKEPYEKFKLNPLPIRKLFDTIFDHFKKSEFSETMRVRDFFRKKDTYEIINRVLPKYIKRQIEEEFR